MNLGRIPSFDEEFDPNTYTDRVLEPGKTRGMTLGRKA
jgi:hypothetical protein